QKLRSMIYYPLNFGRNFDEIMRVVDGLQTADKHGVACPANWTVGDKVIIPPPGTQQAAEERVKTEGIEVTDWYFAKKSI
ncbi:MAG: peroxiredoxin, partial [Myxococcota bacterium]